MENNQSKTYEDTIENYIAMVYEVMKMQDEVKLMIIKDQFLELIKQLSKRINKDYFLAIFCQLYYKICRYKFNREVNENNIHILEKEKQIIEFLTSNYPNFKETSEDTIMIIFTQIFESLTNIDNARINYINENSNIGRTIISNNQLTVANSLLNKNEVLEEELKRNLIQK